MGSDRGSSWATGSTVAIDAVHRPPPAARCVSGALPGGRRAPAGRRSHCAGDRPMGGGCRRVRPGGLRRGRLDVPHPGRIGYPRDGRRRSSRPSYPAGLQRPRLDPDPRLPPRPAGATCGRQPGPAPRASRRNSGTSVTDNPSGSDSAPPARDPLTTRITPPGRVRDPPAVPDPPVPGTRLTTGTLRLHCHLPTPGLIGAPNRPRLPMAVGAFPPAFLPYPRIPRRERRHPAGHHANGAGRCPMASASLVQWTNPATRSSRPSTRSKSRSGRPSADHRRD